MSKDMKELVAYVERHYSLLDSHFNDKTKTDRLMLHTLNKLITENKDLKEINARLDQENKSYIEYIENQDKEKINMKSLNY